MDRSLETGIHNLSLSTIRLQPMKFESKALRPMCVVPFHSFTMQHQETQFPSSPELHPPAPPTIFTSLLEASDVLGANADGVLRSMSGVIPASSQPQQKPSISGRWDAGYRGRLRHDARSPALCAHCLAEVTCFVPRQCGPH